MLGTSKEQQRPSAPTDAGDLADITLRDTDGREVRLGDLWRERPAVLVWLRHYGWIFCRAHAVQLHRDREEFGKAGVELVVIGQGEPEQAANFRRGQRVEELPILADRTRESYKAAGTKVATFSELLGPKVIARGIRAAVDNRRHQGKVVGHAAQLGGVVIVKPDGEIAYSHLSSDASDYPDNAEVLEAAREAVGA